VTDRPSEATRIHTRLLKCTLEVEDSRAYWSHAVRANGSMTARRAFDEFWFGAKSLGRIEVLMANLRETKFERDGQEQTRDWEAKREK
jgi:hypothetical protein